MRFRFPFKLHEITLALAVIVTDQLLVFLTWYRLIEVPFASDRWLPLPVTLTNSIVLMGAAVALRRLPAAFRPGIILVLAGTLSNLLTVIWHGRVVDYLPFMIWRVNVADVTIILGLILIFWVQLHQKAAP